MKNLRIILIAAFFLLATFSASHAQTEVKFDFYNRGPYRAEVPTPQSILRYDVGDHHTTYAQMEKVVDEISKAAPERIRVYDIGTTYEHRMQHLVAISAPENIARIDEIRSNVSRLTDPRRTSLTEAAAIAESNPSIAWMAYTIHGNESSSFEAMMQVIYQLAASNETATLEILKKTVVLVLTGENPDGHERFVTWYNSVAVGSPDRNAIEHREPWSIWGRVNHYRFNLNRDTLAMTQRETKNMAAAYNHWNPQLAVDHHGQPSQYFFPPTSLPTNPNLPQPMFSKWEEIYGRANAKAFDTNKWDYYVRDVFDAFYPGYWDMYPSLNGAIGMTYETDGGGFKGLNWTRDDGTIVTFRSSIAKHYVASLTTLETNAAHKIDRLKDFYEFRAKALADHARAKMKRIVIVPDSDRVKSAELAELLLRSKIEVRVANAAFSSTTARSYMEKNAAASAQTFPAGSYVIDLDQPQRILIKSILEQDTPQDKAFVDDNMARFRRNQMRGKGQPKEDYGFYDITAWSLPLALGVNAFWTEDSNAVQSTIVNDEFLRNAKSGVAFSRASISYVIPYETDSTGAMIMRLLQDGFKIAVATRPLNAGGKNWPAGTFVIRLSRNPETIHESLAKAAREFGVRVISINSGFSDLGDTSVGGQSVVSLRAPKIAIAVDDAVDMESYGAIWWTLDQAGVKFTPMTIGSLKNGGLKNYNVLILPDGSPGRYFSGFGSSGVSMLKDWTSNGGSVITLRGASVFAALKDVGLTSSRMVGSVDDDQKSKPEENKPQESPMPSSKDDDNDFAAASLPPIASPSADANRVPEPLPGSIMRATVDRTTYLNYGVSQNHQPVILASGYFFRHSKEGTNALIFESRPSKL